MYFRELVYFVAVAEEKHFGRAASRLHIAQPPLSTQIKRLEASLGVQLFERSTRNVDLTPAGELLLDRARQILSDLDGAKRDVVAVSHGAAGVVRLGLSGTATYQLLPEFLSAAEALLPDVKITVSGEMLTPTMESELLNRRIDLAILRPPLASAEIEYEEISRSRLYLAFPKTTGYRQGQDQFRPKPLKMRSLFHFQKSRPSH